MNHNIDLTNQESMQMQRMKLNGEGPTSEVYVILRVFNLEGKIGLRVYVDPATSQENGELEFNVDTWAIKTVDNVPT